jgi:hypothetical protein
MLTEAFNLIIQLPPLVFGPALPPAPFLIPRELVCDIHELGRVREPVPAPWSQPSTSSLGPRALVPTPDRHLLNPAVEFMLVMGALASTRGGWDERAWATKRWEATGAVTPVLIPPQPPPIWSIGQR